MPRSSGCYGISRRCSSGFLLKRSLRGDNLCPRQEWLSLGVAPWRSEPAAQSPTLSGYRRYGCQPHHEWRPLRCRRHLRLSRSWVHLWVNGQVAAPRCGAKAPHERAGGRNRPSLTIIRRRGRNRCPPRPNPTRSYRVRIWAPCPAFPGHIDPEPAEARIVVQLAGDLSILPKVSGVNVRTRTFCSFAHVGAPVDYVQISVHHLCRGVSIWM
jgi:hypothetical protein